MYALSLHLEPQRGTLHNRQVTARQLHGMFYQVLGAHNAAEATRIHEHAAPKPYSLRRMSDPSYKRLTGFEFLSLEADAARFAYESWQQVMQQNRWLQLGSAAVCVKQISLRPGGDLTQIYEFSEPITMAKLHFQSLTSFRKGETFSHLPLPADIYRRPLTLWQRHLNQPLPELAQPFESWLAEQVHVTQYNIRTASNSKSGRHRFEGFRGTLSLACKPKSAGHSLAHQRLWSTLTHMLPFCGVGYRTLHGFGTVEIEEMK